MRFRRLPLVFTCVLLCGAAPVQALPARRAAKRAAAPRKPAAAQMPLPPPYVPGRQVVEVPLTPEALYAKCAPTVVSISALGDGGVMTGTGYLWDIGLVATCFHVVAGASVITVELADGRKALVKEIRWADRARDIAVLTLPDEFRKPGAPPHPVTWDEPGVGPPAVGSPVYVIGDPLGLRRSLTPGLVSGIRDGEAFTRLYQISAPVSPGSSGSPVFNQFGRVIGMVTSRVKDAEGLNFCVPMELFTIPRFQASMSLERWVVYSRPPATELLPTPDRLVLQKALHHADGIGVLPLRSLRSVAILVGEVEPRVADVVSRAKLWEVVASAVRKGAPELTILDYGRPGRAAKPDAPFPDEYLSVTVTVEPQSLSEDGETVYAVSPALTLHRMSYLKREGKEAAVSSVLDSFPESPGVWARTVVFALRKSLVPEALAICVGAEADTFAEQAKFINTK